jgi:hypothetical protein
LQQTGNGVASDFQGSFYVGDRGRMAFGEPTRALRINVDDLPGMYVYVFIRFDTVHWYLNLVLTLLCIAIITGGPAQWDEMIQEANRVYSGRVHNLVCDNWCVLIRSLNSWPNSAALTLIRQMCLQPFTCCMFFE